MLDRKYKKAIQIIDEDIRICEALMRRYKPSGTINLEDPDTFVKCRDYMYYRLRLDILMNTRDSIVACVE